MHTFRVILVVLVAIAAVGHRTAAQSLPENLFQRYLEALRLRAAIPGISGVILQNGTATWQQGLGFQDVENRIPASPDSTYPILDLSQTLASTILLQQCLDLRHLEVTDRVQRWIAEYPNDGTTVGQLLSHQATSGAYQYDRNRFATLSRVFEQCASQSSYALGLADEIFEPLGMGSSVPGRGLVDAESVTRRFFSGDQLDRYAQAVRNMAVPYRVDASGHPSRSSYAASGLDASTGIISSVSDLAAFDRALDVDGLLLTHGTREMAWSTPGSRPTGLGWFVQTYDYTSNGASRSERLVWHFGVAPNAYSSLILKVPDRRLTLILLANSDGLSAPYSLENGDITKSHFAKVFLQLFVG